MPPRPATERLHRLLVLVPWLVARGRVPLDEVAAAFGTTRRQVEDDVLLVSMLGVPPYTADCLVDVWLDEDDVVAFPQPYLHRPPTLTPAQGFSLLAAGRGLLEVEGAEGTGPLARALEKLAAVLGDGEGLEIDLQSPPLLPVVRAAVTGGERLRATYYAAWRDELTEREIEPHVVFQRRGRWYVEAACLLRDDVRRFRIDRFRSLEATGARFDPVDAEPPDVAFDPGTDATPVVLDLPASARWVVEAYPLEWEERDGRLRVEVRLLGTAWLERLLLRVGPEAHVVSPPGLADLAPAAARRLLAVYPAPADPVA